MSTVRKLTLSALVAALCVISLALGSFVSRVSLSMAALAGLFPAAAVLCCGFGWGAGVWLTASALALLLLPEKSPALWFACFFGHYPIWKARIEGFQTRAGKPWLGWLLKLLGFAACMALLYLAFGQFFAAGIPFDFTRSAAGPWILAVALLAAFAAYDAAFSILIGWFRLRVLPRLR